MRRLNVIAESRLIRAEQEADEERISKERLANAEAYAVIEAAKAEREAATLRAEAQKMLAEALLVEAKAKAEGEEALIEAKNTADQRILNNEALLKLTPVSARSDRRIDETRRTD